LLSLGNCHFRLSAVSIKIPASSGEKVIGKIVGKMFGKIFE